MLLMVSCHQTNDPSGSPTESTVPSLTYPSNNTSTTAPNNTPTATPNSSTVPTPSTTTDNTSGFIPDKNTYGPYIFGVYEYYLYISSTNAGGTIALIDPKTGNRVLSDTHHGMLNLELTIVSASIMDLNFDGIPDFSYIKNKSHQRECWLADGYMDKNGDIHINSYTYNPALSSIYAFSRCYENMTIYGLDIDGSSSMIGYNFKSDYKSLVKSEQISNPFTWNIEKIAAALAGSNAKIFEVEDVDIRGISCSTVSINGYLTVASDNYGTFYIKDMPTDGFYRLSLNPNGSWSKSEKVSLGTNIVFN